MAAKTPCQTPDAVYGFRISDKTSQTMITSVIGLPFKLDLSEAEAQLLEDNVHNAMELVLARYFTGRHK